MIAASFFAPRSIYKPLILSVILFFSIPLLSNGQDSVPRFTPPPPNHDIERLKHSLSRPVNDEATAESLLEKAQELNYLPGQVVALCNLASINDGEDAGESRKQLQQAQQLALQIKDLREAGWALGQVGGMRGHTASKSTEFKNGLSAVFNSITEGMRKGTYTMHLKTPPKKTDDDDNDDDDSWANLTNSKLSNLLSKEMKKINIPRQPHTPNRDFTDHWLDTLIVTGFTPEKTVSKLIKQKNRRDSARALSKEFAQKGNYAEAFKNFLKYSSYKDSLTAEISNRRLADLQYNQKLLKKEAEIKLLTKDRQLKEQAANRTIFFLFATIGCIAALVTILLILNKNNRAKKRANLQLNAQKEELQQTLAELKSAQTQLVHSEKMASLGELTAGIAHEIQNPLNFVNNFSEVSTELVQELIENQHARELNKETEIELLTDVETNLQKIAMHGKRASAIIKGMLEHSRTGTGEKEVTDLNALIDEYLKLAYHGIRARDKSFEAKLVKNLKIKPANINIVQQEIGRVLLNIFNNAFYAVQQREKTNLNGFEPTVTVSAYREQDEVVIKIKDNGQGIPETIKQKIFQPFFTTKPTGEGTGLGLSLSYDIVTKGHGGKLQVASEADSYTEFTIVLPA